MTGYGRGKSEREGCRVTVEIRSVNHRFLDLKLRGTALDAVSEGKLRQLVGNGVTRGALSVSTRVDRRAGQGELQVDQDLARRAHAQLSELSELLGLSKEIPLSLICSHPGVMYSAEADDGATSLIAELVLEAAGGALGELVAMRETEGASLRRD